MALSVQCAALYATRIELYEVNEVSATGFRSFAREMSVFDEDGGRMNFTIYAKSREVLEAPFTRPPTKQEIAAAIADMLVK